MNVQAIYLDGLHIDDEIIYTDEELDEMYREYKEKVAKKFEFKNWCEKIGIA